MPVEIVGLGGLLHLPEVMDLTATLRLVDDVTANPDLHPAAHRAAVAGRAARPGPARPAGPRARPRSAEQCRIADAAGDDPPGVLDALEQAVADVDPTEVVSLLDALENPGDGAVLRRPPGSGSRRWPPSSATCAGTATSRCWT